MGQELQHYGNWALLLTMAAFHTALTTQLRAALIAEGQFGWLVTNADKPPHRQHPGHRPAAPRRRPGIASPTST
ncbi:MAG: hypothetical protein R3F60_33155 [bacterium]